MATRHVFHTQTVSKIARYADNDREDILALVRLGLTNADEIEQRATSAMVGYVAGQAMLLHNLRDALALARRPIGGTH